MVTMDANSDENVFWRIRPKKNKNIFSNESVYIGSKDHVRIYTISSETVERSKKFDFFVWTTSILTWLRLVNLIFYNLLI
jgi:hypothetical protein